MVLARGSLTDLLVSTLINTTILLWLIGVHKKFLFLLIKKFNFKLFIGNSRLQVFDKNGGFLKFINTELNKLYGPQDIQIVERKNLVAVADSGNHCIKLFNYL